MSSTRWSRVRWIKFGFNDDFEPVCMIANHKCISALAQIDSALALSANSPIRSRFFAQQWMYGNVGIVPTLATAWLQGYHRHTFKGNGSAVKYEGLNLIVSMRLVPDHEMSTDRLDDECLPQQV